MNPGRSNDVNDVTFAPLEVVTTMSSAKQDVETNNAKIAKILISIFQICVNFVPILIGSAAIVPSPSWGWDDAEMGGVISGSAAVVHLS